MENKNIMQDLNDRRTHGNELIFKQNSLPINRFFALDNKTYEEGAIPAKYKELMGLVGSMVLRCNDCIIYHLKNCLELGCTQDELNEAMNIALVIGGSIVIPHLRYAYEALEQEKDSH
ncbi:MAG: carboxymuconolactone decarboxylase family protein [FCB group bacterium]|jgi:AhpD family alkylhydroperoxidase